MSLVIHNQVGCFTCMPLRFLFKVSFPVWIGGTYTPATDIQWVTGEATVYTGLWYPGFPYNVDPAECMLMAWLQPPRGAWAHVPCLYTTPYICEKAIA